VAREAVEQLLEAQSLSSGLDRMNQLNLGELYSSNGDLDKAQEFYLNALALTTTRGPTSAVESALREAYEKNGGAPEQFDSFLERRLAGRKIARRDELLAEPVDFAAPGFRLEDLEGKTFEITQAQGKVIMLTFWASW
jgi:tetratricopeptide (TPR) repeat protein